MYSSLAEGSYLSGSQLVSLPHLPTIPALCKLHWSMLHFILLRSLLFYCKTHCSALCSLHYILLHYSSLSSLHWMLLSTISSLPSVLPPICRFFTSLYFSLLAFLPSPCSTLCSLHSCEAALHRSSLPGGLPPTDTAPPLYCSVLCCTLHTGSGQLCLYTVQLWLYYCTHCILHGDRGEGGEALWGQMRICRRGREGSYVFISNL